MEEKMTTYDKYMATLDAIAILNRLRVEAAPLPLEGVSSAWYSLDSAGRHLRYSLIDDPGLVQEFMASLVTYGI